MKAIHRIVVVPSLSEPVTTFVPDGEALTLERGAAGVYVHFLAEEEPDLVPKTFVFVQATLDIAQISVDLTDFTHLGYAGGLHVWMR